MTFKFSQSKVKTWRRCHRAYHYRYVEEIRKKVKSRPLQFGTLIHGMIETHFNGDDPFEWLEKQRKKMGKTFKVLSDEYGELIRDVSDIMEDYFDHWESDGLEPVFIGNKAAEHEFEIEFPHMGITWTGKIDAFGLRNDLNWLVEHKSFNRKPSVDDRWRNLQSTSYSRAVDILGWDPVDGTCWDYVWSKPPAEPKVLQSGELSQAKLDTLPNVARRTVKKLGLDRKKYKGYFDKIKLNRGKWFDRVYTPLQTEVVDLLFEDFLTSAREMSERHGQAKTMNIERHCTWCDYEPLCRARLEGGDYEYVKERNYEKSKKPKLEKGKVIHKKEQSLFTQED